MSSADDQHASAKSGASKQSQHDPGSSPPDVPEPARPSPELSTPRQDEPSALEQTSEQHAAFPDRADVPAGDVDSASTGGAAGGSARSSGSDSGAFLVGQTLGDYRLLRRLGHGGMAEVYLAEQQALRRHVAVKVLKRNLAGDSTYVARFQREAQAAAALVHANIVQIYEIGSVDGTFYIAQEYVQGQNLRQWLSRHGPPDAAAALLIIRQVAAALAKASEHGIVHRDIKPENIMVTRSGEIKVADFGLARLTRDDDALELTQVGITLGTPLYMSPEQVEGRSLDSRSDIYSLGVTCYHMLAGEPPFRGSTVLSVAVQHLKTPAAPLQSSRTDLPASLCAIVDKMLAKRPDDRYETPRALLQDLGRVAAEIGVAHASVDIDSAFSGDGVQATWAGGLEVTQQLKAAMAREDGATTRHRRGLVKLAVACVVAFVIGGGVAAVSRTDRTLLQAAEGRSAIEKQASVLQQWYYAVQSGTPEAFASVIEYFPENAYFSQLAEQHIAWIALGEGDYDEAMRRFEKLALRSEEGSTTWCFGTAGKCGVLALQGQHEQSTVLLAELWPFRSSIADPRTQQLLRLVLEKNRALDELRKSRWQESLNAVDASTETSER